MCIHTAANHAINLWRNLYLQAIWKNYARFYNMACAMSMQRTMQSGLLWYISIVEYIGAYIILTRKLMLIHVLGRNSMKHATITIRQ